MHSRVLGSSSLLRHPGTAQTHQPASLRGHQRPAGLGGTWGMPCCSPAPAPRSSFSPSSETDHPISATPLLLPQRMPQASSCGAVAATPRAQLAPRTPSRRRKALFGPHSKCCGWPRGSPHEAPHLWRALGPSSQGAERGLQQKAGRRPLQEQPQGERALPLGPPGAASSGNLNGCWSPCLRDFIFIFFFFFAFPSRRSPECFPTEAARGRERCWPPSPTGRAHTRH